MNQIYKTCVIAFIIVENILLSLELVNIEFLVFALLFGQIFADVLSYIFFYLPYYLTHRRGRIYNLNSKVVLKGWLT